MREKRGSVVLGAREKIKRRQENDGVVVLSLDGLLVGLLAPAVPLASPGVTIGTELLYFASQPEREALV